MKFNNPQLTELLMTYQVSAIGLLLRFLEPTDTNSEGECTELKKVFWKFVNTYSLSRFILK